MQPQDGQDVWVEPGALGHHGGNGLLLPHETCNRSMRRSRSSSWKLPGFGLKHLTQNLRTQP